MFDFSQLRLGLDLSLEEESAERGQGGRSEALWEDAQGFY